MTEFWAVIAALATFFIGGPLLLLAVFFVRWAIKYPAHTYRYKVKVEIDTPSGVRSGSQVHQVRWRSGPRLGGANTGSHHLKGEAIAVDLDENETLYALLGAAHTSYASPAFGTERVTKTTSREPVELKALPKFVRFGDEADPASAQDIDPGDLAATYGAGYALRRVVVQIVDDPPTCGIERRLPWLPRYYSLQLSGDRYQSLKNEHKGIAAFIGAGNFSAGFGLNKKERR